MKYEGLAEKIVEHYNTENIFFNNEDQPIEEVAKLLVGGTIAGATYYWWNHGIPKIVEGWARDNIFYQVASIIDPTGIMSWPYIQLALERREEGKERVAQGKGETVFGMPEEKANEILLVLACLSVIPGMGMGARWILLALKSIPAKWTATIRIANGLEQIGKQINNTPRVKDAIGSSISRLYGNSYKGIDGGKATREAFESVAKVKYSDEAIVEAAKRAGIDLSKAGPEAQKVFRTALESSAKVKIPKKDFSKTTKELGKDTAKIGSRLAPATGKAKEALKTAGAVGRTATAGAAMGGALSRPGGNNGIESLKSFLNQPRTPTIRGPRVLHGQAGARGATLGY